MDKILMYIDSLEGIKQELVSKIVIYMNDKSCVKTTFDYKMPTYRGENFYIAFAAQKNYFSFYTDEVWALGKLKEAIPSASLGKNCARIKYKEENIVEIIKGIIDVILYDKNELL